MPGLRPLDVPRRLARPSLIAGPPPGPYRRAVQSQSVRGTIGTVVDLQAQVAAAMALRRLSWTALARKVGCSRQYLRKALARPEVPADRRDRSGWGCGRLGVASGQSGDHGRGSTATSGRACALGVGDGSEQEAESAAEHVRTLPEPGRASTRQNTAAAGPSLPAAHFGRR